VNHRDLSNTTTYQTPLPTDRRYRQTTAGRSAHDRVSHF